MVSCRLYLITPPLLSDLSAYAETLRAALGAGDVACLQLRLKDVDDDAVLRAADVLLPIAHEHEVAFLVNDRSDLAKRAGADGVHLGQNDTPYKQARSLLGDEATIGVTCHNSKDLALNAGEAGADYVAFGAFFPTETKQASTRADPELLAWWSYATTVPCVAIGGITPNNCRPLIEAGADFLAVSSSIWNCPGGAAKAIAQFADMIGR